MCYDQYGLVTLILGSDVEFLRVITFPFTLVAGNLILLHYEMV